MRRRFQDAWNTTPAWGFPYTTSALGPSPSASPLIAGAFAGNTLGTTAYALWDSHTYVEAGLYWTPRQCVSPEPLAPVPTGTIDGASPYFRAAYQQDFGDQNFEVGAFALFPNLHPPGVAGAATDDYSDIGLDGSYQFMGTGDNVYTANARYTFEQQNLGASFGAGKIAANAHDFSRTSGSTSAER